MADDVHSNFQESEPWHGKGFGCLWKHGNIKKGQEECDYRKNGYDISKDDRTDVYNKDHLTEAKNKKYVDADGAPSQQSANDLADDRMASYPKGKDAVWKAKWLENLASPFGLLAVDKDAWHIGHIFDDGASKVIPWWGSRKPITPKTNFLPLPHKGWHYMFPYKHTYHHLIEKDSFLTYVINAPVSSDAVTQFLRKKIVISKEFLHWNINNKDNVILLPNEVPHAEVVGLPCHCPWDTCSHPKYSSILKKKLEKVRKKIDAAVEDGDHPKIGDAEDILLRTQKDLYDEVKDISGPL